MHLHLHPSGWPRRMSRGNSESSSGTDQFLENFCIPNYILNPECEVDNTSLRPSCPVIVFINGRSGGQLGGDLLKTYGELLNSEQVFDLGTEAPEKVLQRIFCNMERLRCRGDNRAAEIEKNLRLIVAGGDGTASWLLGVVCDLKLARPPPIATVPLGTGNNLPFSFGWGKKNPGTDSDSVKAFLKQVLDAREMKIDNWHIIMRMRAPEKQSCEPIAPLELPHSLHAFHRVSDEDSLNKEGHHTFRGGFWNYFSMGMDAQVSYEFHSERKLHPEKFKNQLVNQKTYLKLGLSRSFDRDPSRNISQLVKVKVMNEPGGAWTDLVIPDGIKSIICVNLPSFSGGLNPWGMPGKRDSENFTAPFVDDGRIEVVGFRDVWHGLALLSSHGHGHRLAQAHRIIFEFHKGAAEHTFMRMDGEPWKQPLPMDDDTVLVEISHHGQVNMLASTNCKSKSIHDDASEHSTPTHGDNSEDENSEERRKFGAAETFKLPDDIDIACLN